jgi:plasmid stabilization system protein ParE
MVAAGAKRSARYLGMLLSRNARSEEKAARDIQRAVELAATFPMANRAARTESERIKSLPKWHKIIIYKVEVDRIVIVSIPVTRQEPPR